MAGKAAANAYREDIDRLRGLAVLAVMAFHFDEALGAHGGYVGVDIFFVISGFLITQIIQREIRAGSFSFAVFYERRVRRLLPALYVVILASIPAAFHFLLPSERQDFLRSVIAVVTFSSNILFWSQSGYFDRTAVEKPLLHTWSLSVEEQFYLLLPVIVWAILRFRPKALPVALVAITAASFILGLWLMQNGRVGAAFYLSPARAWEFLIGSIIAIDGFPMLKNKASRLAVTGTAYAFLLIPIFGLRANSAFPGWHAVYPCVGAALFIWAGTGAPVVAPRHRFSPYRLAIFFGTISYSMYLWHWPLFTFARFSKENLTLSGPEKALLFLATIAISYLSTRFIEQPFRLRAIASTRRYAFAGAAAASIVLVVISGLSLIVPASTTGKAGQIAKLDGYNRYDELDAYRGGCFRTNNDPLDLPKCVTMSPDRPNVLLWGDSHAAHYYPGLARMLGDRANLMQATQAGCMPAFQMHPKTGPWCRDFANVIVPWLTDHTPSMVILSGDWLPDLNSSRFEWLAESMRGTIKTLTDRGIRVVLIGPSIQFKTGLPSILIRSLARGDDEPPANEVVRSDLFDGDAKMKAAFPNAELFNYISVVEAACPNHRCPLVVNGDVPLVWDYGHLTVEGSQYVVGKISPFPNFAKARSEGM